MRNRAADLLMLMCALMVVAAVAAWIGGYFVAEQIYYRRWHCLTAEPSYPIDSFMYGVGWSRGTIGFFAFATSPRSAECCHRDGNAGEPPTRCQT